MLALGSDEDDYAGMRERIYIAAIDIMECNRRLSTDTFCKPYGWLVGASHNYHTVAYILAEMCRRPRTALVKCGWDAVQPCGISLTKDSARTERPGHHSSA